MTMGSIENLAGVFFDAANGFIGTAVNAIESVWNIGTGSLEG